MSARAASAVLALAGLAIAGYLVVVHYSGAEPVCAIAHGCEVVQRSRYSELAGIPVALVGALGYAGLLACLLRDDAAARGAAAFLSLTGAAFSAWLTYVELAILEAVCIWCVASALCMAALAGLSTARMVRSPAPAPRPRPPRSPRGGRP